MSAAGNELVVGVRPEHLTMSSSGISGEVVVVEELGSEAFVHVKIPHQGGDDIVVVVRAGGETDIQRGDTHSFTIGGPTHVFAAGSGERLGD